MAASSLDFEEEKGAFYGIKPPELIRMRIVSRQQILREKDRLFEHCDQQMVVEYYLEECPVRLHLQAACWQNFEID